MAKARTIQVNDTRINVLLNKDQNDYICLTDMTKNFEDGARLIEKWLNNKSTIDFMGVWEQLNNPNFKTPEFGGIRMEAGSNRFYMSVKYRTGVGMNKVERMKTYTLSAPVLLAYLLRPVAMEEPMLIKILHTILVCGCLRNSIYL